jgi:hypothetical protein
MTSELETGVSEPTDVIASSDTVLGMHGVDYYARREHVQLQGREGRLQVVPVFLPTLANRAVLRVLLAML